MNLSLEGECYCGSIAFVISISKDPDEAKQQVKSPGYCHCFDCKRASAAPLSEAFFVQNSCFRWRRGEELIKHYQKALGTPVRSFCTNCGTRVAVTLPESMPNHTGIYTALLDNETQQNLPAALEPSTEFYRESSTLKSMKYNPHK